MPSIVEQNESNESNTNNMNSKLVESSGDHLTSLNHASATRNNNNSSSIGVASHPSSNTNFASSLATKNNNPSCMCNSSASSLLLCSSNIFCANCLHNNELYIESNSASSSSLGSMAGGESTTVLLSGGHVNHHPSPLTLSDTQGAGDITNSNETTLLAAANMADITMVSCSNSTRSRSSSRSGGTSSNSSMNTHNLIRESQNLNNPRIGKQGKSKRCLNKRAKRPLSTSSAANTIVSNDTTTCRLALKNSRSGVGGKKRSSTAPRYLPLPVSSTPNDHLT
jgi:hypothetical protein